MGQRANLLIVENGEYTLYYSHWCASTITSDLFWGPDHAIRFIRVQEEVDESSWLDDVWAEGGAVVDRDKRVLLLFGGEDIRYDVELRRVYLKILRRVWSPWEVRWAYEGIADIADYVGYPRAKVTSKAEPRTASSLFVRDQLDMTNVVGSFRLADGTLRLYPLAGNVEFYVLVGPSLAGWWDGSTGVEDLPLDEGDIDVFPGGGFHIDLAAKGLEYWTAKDISHVPGRVSAMWSDWNVTWHRDDFETQLRTTDGNLRFPTQSVKELQEQISKVLLRESGRSPVDTVVEIAEKDREEGMDVTVNPRALQDDRLELSVEERKRILAVASGGVDR